jgi:hypothetical protein
MFINKPLHVAIAQARAAQAKAAQVRANRAALQRARGLRNYEEDSDEDFEVYESSEFGALPSRHPFPGMGMRHLFPGKRPPFPGMHSFHPRSALTKKTTMISSPTTIATGVAGFGDEEMGLYTDDGFGNYGLQGVLMPKPGTPAWKRRHHIK